MHRWMVGRRACGALESSSETEARRHRSPARTPDLWTPSSSLTSLSSSSHQSTWRLQKISPSVHSLPPPWSKPEAVLATATVQPLCWSGGDFCSRAQGTASLRLQASGGLSSPALPGCPAHPTRPSSPLLEQRKQVPTSRPPCSPHLITSSWRTQAPDLLETFPEKPSSLDHLFCPLIVSHGTFFN